jgi:hypothetical protein
MKYDEVRGKYDEVRVKYDEVRVKYDEVRVKYDEVRTPEVSLSPHCSHHILIRARLVCHLVSILVKN